MNTYSTSRLIRYNPDILIIYTYWPSFFPVVMQEAVLLWLLWRLPSIIIDAVPQETLKETPLTSMAMPSMISWTVASCVSSSIWNGSIQVRVSMVFLEYYVVINIPFPLTNCFDAFYALVGRLSLRGCWGGGYC